MRANHQPEQERIEYLEKDNPDQRQILAEWMAERKKVLGDLARGLVPHSKRDQIVDYVRCGSGKTEIGIRRSIEWLGIVGQQVLFVAGAI